MANQRSATTSASRTSAQTLGMGRAFISGQNSKQLVGTNWLKSQLVFADECMILSAKSSNGSTEWGVDTSSTMRYLGIGVLIGHSGNRLPCHWLTTLRRRSKKRRISALQSNIPTLDSNAHLSPSPSKRGL